MAKNNIDLKNRLDKLKETVATDKDKSTAVETTEDIKESKINDKQKRFIEEYLIDTNAAQAAIRAGYSKDTAPQMAYKLMNNPAIKSAIEENKKQMSIKLSITRESILNDLEYIKQTNTLDSPAVALKAIELQIKMLGLNEPEKTETKITGLNLKDMIRFK